MCLVRLGDETGGERGWLKFEPILLQADVEKQQVHPTSDWQVCPTWILLNLSLESGMNKGAESPGTLVLMCNVRAWWLFSCFLKEPLCWKEEVKAGAISQS